MENTAYMSLQASQAWQSSTQDFPPRHLVTSHSPRQVKSNSLYRHQHLVASPQPTTHRPPSILSPNNTLLNTSPPQIRVQMGGSRQKQPPSHTRKISIVSPKSSMNGIGSNGVEGYLRRIGELEMRVRGMERERAEVIGELEERVRRLVGENQRLLGVVREMEEERKKEEEEFNLEQMLQQQININLQLREELETTKAQLQELKAVNETFQQTTRRWEQENQTEQEAHQKIIKQWEQDKTVLQEEITQLTTALQQQKQRSLKREEVIQQLIQQKQARILQAQEQAYTLQQALQTKNAQMTERVGRWEQLCEQLSTLKIQRLRQQEQNQELRQRLGKAQECNKCKDLLRTVFRLNAQLNKH